MFLRFIWCRKSIFLGTLSRGNAASRRRSYRQAGKAGEIHLEMFSAAAGQLDLGKIHQQQQAVHLAPLNYRSFQQLKHAALRRGGYDHQSGGPDHWSFSPAMVMVSTPLLQDTFLIGRSLQALPDPPSAYQSITVLHRWKLCWALARHFWKQ